ncbi:MAG: MotA/TolQ/ExbB proton channel family protein [Thermoguttaceae bacterium]
MTRMDIHRRWAAGLALRRLLLGLALAAIPAWLPRAGLAQQEPAPAEAKAARLLAAEQKAEAALAAGEPARPEPAGQPQAPPAGPEMNLWELTVAGGPLMIPIGLCSVLVVAISLERLVALRRRYILPKRFLARLRALGRDPGGLDPQEAQRVCQQFPSAAAGVLRAMLLKAGRSRAEMEKAASEAAQREADRLAGPVRWLSLSASVAPMLGLLGTVQGMILAFYQTSLLPPVGADRAHALAKGIYIALVTTFGGLTVAIPAAILAHLFAGRILRLFREMEEAIPLWALQLEKHHRQKRAASQPLAPPRVEPPPPPGEARGKHPAPTH